MSILTVGDFMTKSPHAIEPHESLALAIERMRKLKVLHLPVRASGRPVGILSERDLGAIAGRARQADLKAMKVADVMTPDPFCVTVDTPLSVVAGRMADSKIGSALVVGDRGELVGIFTVTDGMLALANVT